jgi:putative flippase GtrA
MDKENQRIDPIFYSLLTIGVTLFIAMICLASLTGELIRWGLILTGMDLYTIFWVSNIVPIVIVVICAYYLSRNIWIKAKKNPKNLRHSLRKMILFMIVIWVIQLCFPLIVVPQLIGYLPKTPGFYYSHSQESVMNIVAPIFHILEMTLILLAVAIKKR